MSFSLFLSLFSLSFVLSLLGLKLCVFMLHAVHADKQSERDRRLKDQNQCCDVYELSDSEANRGSSYLIRGSSLIAYFVFAKDALSIRRL